MYDNSTPIGGKVSSDIGALIAAINKFPKEWALTPCVGKRNLWPGWQREKLDRQQLIEAIRSQKNHEGKPCAWTGASIVTGPLSNGVMAVDFDGSLALKKYFELSGGKPPETTKRWSSGKPGHFQILLTVPREKWEELTSTKFFILKSSYRLELGLSTAGLAKKIGVAVEDVEKWESGSTSPIPPAIAKKLATAYGSTTGELCQKLEFRWGECSTLPPSIHPDTGNPYAWKYEGAIAECPEFILDLMELPQKPKPETTTYLNVDKTLVEILEQEILPRLDAEEFYGNWVALKPSGKNLKGLCPFHEEKTPSFTVTPSEKTFHCFGCGVGGGSVQFLHQINGGSGTPTGKDFYSVVTELADRVGVRMPERKFPQNPESKIQNPIINNVVPLRPVQNPPISGLGEEIEALLDSDLKKSQLQLKISELAQKFRTNSADIWKIYREREQELEQEASQEDTKTGIDQLLASQSASVKLSDIFPESLAAPIEIVANRMNLKPECYALALISGVSRFLKNGSSTMLVEEWNRYRCRTHGYFGAMIAEASQMKTPVLNAMIVDPLAAMREDNKKKFDAQKKAYEEELEQWKNSKDEDKGSAPNAPVEKFAYITKATWEGVAGMVGRAPEQGILWLCDELAGFFKSANQYRSGRGSDKEDLLECWSGNGAVIARASGTTVNVGAVSLSIYGNIQPKVFAPFLGDGSDDNGTFARFDFVQQPPALTQITLGLSKIDINPMLQALYERVDAIPVTEFALDEEARKLFVDYYNHCQQLRLNHPKQGMRAMLGKAAEKVGRVATILHCIHAAHLGGEVSPQIPASRVRAAIKWVEYTTEQALSINIEVCSPDALESNLAKIISLAERKGGTVTARDVLLSFNPKYRPTPQKIREWFGELTAMKYGEITQKGNSILFSLHLTSTVSTPSQNSYTASTANVYSDIHTTSTTSTISGQKHQTPEQTVDDCGRGVDNNVHTLKPNLDISSNFTVDTVDVVAPSPKIAPPSMLSCTTEPEEFAEQIRKAIANFDRPLAIQVTRALKDKTELRKEVRATLTADEFDNFRLLVTAGFIKGTRVKYVGTRYHNQLKDLELVVSAINSRSEISCLQPDGYLTTWLKPEDLEIIS